MEPVNANGSREQATEISQRRVCDLVGVDAKTVRRERPPDHADIRKQIHEIAEKRRRFGYRRVGILLEREGFTMNGKKLYRLYKEEGLSVRRRRGRKRARGTRVPMPIPNRPHMRWSPDPRHGHSDQRRIHGAISSLADARQKLALWRYDCNNVRPHSSLGNLTPAAARRALEINEAAEPGALAQPETDNYQQARLSL